MGRPPGSPNKSKTPEGISEQAKTVGGFSSLESVASQAPASTVSDATPEVPGAKKPAAAPRPQKQKPEVDPNMSDPRYKQAIANMTAGTSEKLIGAPFELWAWAAKDPSLRLTDAEQLEWADFMYVCTKKANLDPTSPRFLVCYGILMLGKQSVSRMIDQYLKKGGEIPPEVAEVVNQTMGTDIKPTPPRPIPPRPAPAPAPAPTNEVQLVQADEVMEER